MKGVHRAAGTSDVVVAEGRGSAGGRPHPRSRWRSGDFGQGGLNVIGRGELRACERGGDQRVMREQIDLAGQTGGGLKERFFSRRIEERDRGAGEPQPMAEIGREFVAGERRHVMADDNPLRERLVHGHGEAAPQFGLPEQDETQPILGIHLVIGEESEVLEDVRAQVVGFVDDEDRPDPRIGAQPEDFAFDLDRAPRASVRR